VRRGTAVARGPATALSAATEVLAPALAAEYAAIFGYGVVGAHLDKTTMDSARQAEAAHRSRRDTLLLLFATAKVTPPAAEAAYALPFPVTDRTSAIKLAMELEDGTARAWHDAIAATDGSDRAMAVAALIDCAVRATRWRRTAGITPATQTFPGTPS
jgi:uncharacterized protein DUF4439